MRNKVIGLTCMCIASLSCHASANDDFSRFNIIGEFGIQRGGDELSIVQQIDGTDSNAAGDGVFLGLGLERLYPLGGNLWSTEFTLAYKTVLDEDIAIIERKSFSVRQGLLLESHFSDAVYKIGAGINVVDAELILAESAGEIELERLVSPSVFLEINVISMAIGLNFIFEEYEIVNTGEIFDGSHAALYFKYIM